MSKKIKITLLLIGLIIIFGGLILISRQVPISDQGEGKETAEENSNLQEEYPNNLLEGVVKAVNIGNKTLTLEAKTGLIKTSQQDRMEKSIKVTESTICEIYHIDIGKTDSCQFSEIIIGDNIVVATLESTYDGVNNLEEFTAVKIVKMAAEIKISNE